MKNRALKIKSTLMGLMSFSLFSGFGSGAQSKTLAATKPPLERGFLGTERSLMERLSEHVHVEETKVVRSQETSGWSSIVASLDDEKTDLLG